MDPQSYIMPYTLTFYTFVGCELKTLPPALFPYTCSPPFQLPQLPPGMQPDQFSWWLSKGLYHIWDIPDHKDYVLHCILCTDWRYLSLSPTANLPFSNPFTEK